MEVVNKGNWRIEQKSVHGKRADCAILVCHIGWSNVDGIAHSDWKCSDYVVYFEVFRVYNFYCERVSRFFGDGSFDAGPYAEDYLSQDRQSTGSKGITDLQKIGTIVLRSKFADKWRL